MLFLPSGGDYESPATSAAKRRRAPGHGTRTTTDNAGAPNAAGRARTDGTVNDTETWFQGGGEMGERLRAHAWETTPLDAPSQWPRSLRTAVSLMLGARQPVYIAWGPELTSLYNDAYIPIFGAKHPAALGRPYREVWPEIWPQSEPALQRTLAGEAQYFIDEPVPLTGRPGRPVSWFTVSWTPLRDDDGAVGGVYCTAMETTERMMAQQAMEHRVATRTAELHRRAEQLSRLTSELTLTEQRERRRLAKTVHDHLQQTVAAARVSLDVALGKLAPGDAKRLQRLGVLIDEAQRISQNLSTELSPPVLHEMGLPAGLQWLGDWVERMHGLAVRVSVDKAADPAREDIRILLFESARELLFNVVKHAGVREASLDLSLVDERWIRLMVTDTGKGLDADALLQGDGYLGAGFGLFSIRERVSLLGGLMDCTAQPGSGTRISLRLPTAPAGPDSGPAPLDPTPPGIRALATKQHAQPLIRVLVAIDHRLSREGLSILIDVAAGMVVTGEAHDGESAIRLTRALKPDVVLMDNSLPDMTGAEAARRINSDAGSRGNDVRVIGLLERDEQARDMLAAGAAGCLSKLDSASRLLDRIRESCARDAGDPA